VTAAYAARVYDLDGTLVRLDVDWEAAREDAVAALAARGVGIGDVSLWEALERAETTGYGGVVEEILADHERNGARSAGRLPLADDLPADVPVGVCSLNAEAACRIALEGFDLGDHVNCLVGRDTVDGRKPDPEPLLAVVDALGVGPDEALFIGDSESDALAAERAGVDFQYAAEREAER
jgi:phosphoglycolate phosphatase